VILVCSLWSPSYFLFPLGLTYLTLGVARQAVLGLLERHEPGVGMVERDEADDEDITAPRAGLRRGREE
jgi:hypothetical protein